MGAVTAAIQVVAIGTAAVPAGATKVLEAMAPGTTAMCVPCPGSDTAIRSPHMVMATLATATRLTLSRIRFMATPIRNTDMPIRPMAMGTRRMPHLIWTMATNAAHHSPMPPLVPQSAALSPEMDITTRLALRSVPLLEPLLAVGLDQEAAAEGFDGYRGRF